MSPGPLNGAPSDGLILGFEVGDRVRWRPDQEPGTVVAVNEYALAVAWDMTGTEFYPAWSLATERIEPLLH